MEINKVEVILEKVKKELSLTSFILGIVLGGSRASGTANGNSDIDIGIYYDKDVDYNQLNLIAKKLDDNNRENLICHEGEWGESANVYTNVIVKGRRIITRLFLSMQSVDYNQPDLCLFI